MESAYKPATKLGIRYRRAIWAVAALKRASSGEPTQAAASRRSMAVVEEP